MKKEVMLNIFYFVNFVIFLRFLGIFIMLIGK